MASAIQNNFRARKSFAKLKQVIEIPNLIDIQKRSYDKFLQMDIALDRREDIGLQGVFKSVFPIKDFSETSSLEFVSYNLEKPKYDVDECRARGMTFAAPIKVVIRLVVWDVNEETGVQSIRDVKEQEVYFGEIPLMTDSGTFIINGTERVIVSQLHRSPGVFFDHDKGKTHSSGKLLYSARVIPYRGSWLDFEFDHKDILYVRIDRRRKLYGTVLLRALGYSTEELLNYFYDTEFVHIEGKGKYAREINYELLVGQRATRDIKHPKTKEVLVKKNRKFTKGAIRKLQESDVDKLPLDADEIAGKVSAKDVIDDATGEVLLQCNEELTEQKLEELRERGVIKVEVLFIDNLNVGPYLRNTLLADKLQGPEEAIMEIYRRLRPGDPPTIETANNLFQNLFFNAERYDLSRVGRIKLNYKFKIDEPIETQILTKRDILETVRYLIDLRNGKGVVDDIDHLGNRRVRAVGELMENQYRIGLVRMERAIKERMSMSQEIETLMPHDLINAKPVSAVVKEFFGSSQLSQFMDQTNPLSEVTHKRRLSALGPGGLTRERAGFEVRDVHPTHYGRICPIETPEGPNIGLIASLSTFARVNEYGFIETPYRKVEGGKVTTRNRALLRPTLEEEGQIIAAANADIEKTGKLAGDYVSCRKGSDVVMTKPEDVTPHGRLAEPARVGLRVADPVPRARRRQPRADGLEHAAPGGAAGPHRCRRSSAPAWRASSPVDSGVTVVAKRDGVVDFVDGSRIVVRPTTGADPTAAKPDIYNLVKFQRSNQNTCMNQKPIVQGRQGEEG
jgi:DNA-directed RNA polymerase subunit beta